MKLYNDRIRIIPFEVDHWPYFYNWQHTGDYFHFFGNSPLFDSKTAASLNHHGKIYTIVSPDNVSSVLGAIYIQSQNEVSRNLVYGILIDKEHQSKKIGMEASKMFLDYVFNMLNFYKVIALVNEDNLTAVNGAEKIGMVKEAELIDELYYNGEFKNVFRYYIKKGHFNKLHKSKPVKAA